MKKNKLIVILYFLIMFSLSAQTVERLAKREDIKLKVKIVNVMPEGIMVDEKNDDIYLINGGSGGSWIYNCENNCVLFDKTVPILNGIERVKLNEYLISYSDTGIFINNIINEKIANLNNKVQSGISFILKKGSGYIIYYVDTNGLPGAVDTEGKIYTNKEVISYLKQYDSEKYEESLLRAEELGLKNAFEKAEILVWGKTVYKPKQYLLQYDEGGLSYSFECSGKWGTFVGCYLNDEEIMSMDNLNDFTTLIGKGKDYSTSWYVGFGGNIYYYIAGEEYTEVFRIRRTWGDPDFYAMAINGYTDDEYGKYVDEVLPTLSKSALRLLRNTIFALYGVHFNSDDLTTYFDKQVWYTDEGKSFSDIQLPAHRQKLVEIIQGLEEKFVDI